MNFTASSPYVHIRAGRRMVTSPVWSRSSAALTLVLLTLSFATPAARAFIATGSDASVWPRLDGEIGVTGFMVEDFEDEFLSPGLLVELSDCGDNYGATNRLPLAFHSVTHDPNGAQVFVGGVWDGARTLINRRTPVPTGYVDGNWGDLTFHFPGGASSVGFSVQQNEVAGTLRINGNPFASLTGYLGTGTGRNGYLRVDASPGEIIYSITIVNEGGDGISFDHLAFRPAECLEGQPSVPAGLVAWYRGGTNAQDSAGIHHGTLQNGTGFAAGKVDMAFNFDGANDYVDLGNWFNLQAFTLALWVNPQPVQQAYADIIDNNHTDYRSWVIQYDNVGLQFHFGANGLGGLNFNLTANTWQHLVVTVDTNRQLRVFLDGQLLGTVEGSGPISYDGSQFLRLSAWGGGGRHFNGLIDEVQIFDRPLATSEVVGLLGNRYELAIRASGDRVIVEWPLACACCVLEASEHLGPAASWIPLGTPPQSVDNRLRTFRPQ